MVNLNQNIEFLISAYHTLGYSKYIQENQCKYLLSKCIFESNFERNKFQF